MLNDCCLAVLSDLLLSDFLHHFSHLFSVVAKNFLSLRTHKNSIKLIDLPLVSSLIFVSKLFNFTEFYLNIELFSEIKIQKEKNYQHI